MIVRSIVAIVTMAFVVSVHAEAGWAYGERGLEWSGGDTGSYTWVGLRGQFRASNIADDLRDPEDFSQADDSDIWVNRSRYKIGARWRKDVSFYHEYDLRNSLLLDLRATWVSNPKFNVRVGQ